MAIDFPNSPSTGQQFVSPSTMYLYDGASSWTTKADTQSANPFTNSFKYRTIYTRGYTCGGYIGGSPWRNVNRTVHATDITTNLGDMLDYPASYKTGCFSDYYTYIYGESATHSGLSNYTGSINMSTESNRSHSTSWDMTNSRYDAEAMANPSLSIGYIVGGGSAVTDKHNYVTETMYAAGSAPNLYTSGGTNGGVGVFFGAMYGWASVGAGAGLAWATETWNANGSLSWSTDGQPKGLSSKHGFGYGSTGSYAGTTTLYKFNDITGGSAVSSMGRPESAGEENWQIGQNWGYSLGSYNGGAQTNNASKVSYTSDTCVAMGSDTMPKGHDGMSSGCCGTASARMVGGV